MAGNTTPIHGKTARSHKNGTDIEFTASWTINVRVDIADKSRQGKNWKEHIAGQGEWDGSIECQFVAGNTEQYALMTNIVTASPGTVLDDLKFMLEDSGDYFSGNLIINSMPVSAPVGDVVKVSFNFIGDDALSLTTA